MKLLIKVDIDTFRGTKQGLKPLCRVFEKHAMPALFLFSLGPDNTGKAMSRVFRKGFIKKCLRSNVAGNYGLKTLLYGTLLPAPVIYKECAEEMRAVRDDGFACGIHAWDHFNWQDNLGKMSIESVREEFALARRAFKDVFGENARTCGAAGWQCTYNSLFVQDEAGLDYASDVRGAYPFKPQSDSKIFNTLQIPTTLPTLDEILGAVSLNNLSDEYVTRMKNAHDGLSVMTCHAELEGMAYIDWLDAFLTRVKNLGVEFCSFEEVAKNAASSETSVPVCEVALQDFEGRATKLAVQKI